MSQELAGYADSVASQFHHLLNVPKKRIETLHANLSDIRHRKAMIQSQTDALVKELADFERADKENAIAKEAPLTEEECSRFLPVLSALTLSTVERGENGKWSVKVGKLACEAEFIEKNWEYVGEALQRIN